jgi:hypothetical protein
MSDPNSPPWDSTSYVPAPADPQPAPASDPWAWKCAGCGNVNPPERYSCAECARAFDGYDPNAHHGVWF